MTLRIDATPLPVPALPPGCRRLSRHAPGWPAVLEHLELPPSSLWLAGPLPPAWPAVAIVGSRDASLGGLEVARRLAGDLALAGIPVISGMALGIDGAAHAGTLDGGGHTVAVLGCGLDVDYPLAHGELRRHIAGTGTVLTEQPPGTQPVGWFFPRRNRIIAALATAVVVVEASQRSGALSTARHAADLGRDLFAVPGSVLSGRSEGANRLIRDGATPLIETADLAAVPALAAAIDANRSRFLLDGGARTRRPPRAAAHSLRPELRTVLARLGPDPVHPDALGAALGLGPATLAARLVELELAGLACTVAGGLLVRAPVPSHSVRGD